MTRHSELERQIGLPGALAIGLGTMMGAGIFVLSADAAARAGPAAALSFVLAGLICLPIAMTVSELVTAMPEDGGSYHLVARTLGPAAGAVVGPANWLGLVFACGFYLIGFAQFVGMVADVPAPAAAAGLGALFVVLNYLGAKLTGVVQYLVVALLLGILLLFVIGGVPAIEPQLHEPFAPEGWMAAVGVVGLILVSFTGFEKISTVAEEVRRPGRTLPLAIIGSVVIATVVYAAVIFVFTGLVPAEALEGGDETALVEASGHALGTAGIWVMLVGGILATASSANAALLASSRIGFAMGRDRILPRGLAAIHRRWLTPHRAILLTGSLAVALALTGEVARLAEISSTLFIISYLLLTVGLLVMRRLSPTDYRPAFRVPLHPWLPAAGGLAVLAVLLTMDRVSLVAGLGLAGVSVLWYLAWGRSRTPVRGAARDLLGEIHPLRHVSQRLRGASPEPTRTEVLVLLDDESGAREMLRLGAGVAAGRGEGVRGLRVQVVPDTLPLQDAGELEEHHLDPEGELAEAVSRIGEETGVEIQLSHRAARTPARGLRRSIEEHRPVSLVMMRHRPERMIRTRKLAREMADEDGVDVVVVRGDLPRHPAEVRIHGSARGMDLTERLREVLEARRPEGAEGTVDLAELDAWDEVGADAPGILVATCRPGE